MARTEAVMWARTAGPRIEDFGITEDDLARAPRLFFPNHRPGLVAVIYLVVVAAIFTVILETGHSWIAAAFFAFVLVAASSVLLLPAVMLALCAGERMEERWLCRRVPVLRACLAYERAVEEHRTRLAMSSRTRPAKPEDWCSYSPSTFRSEVGRLLDRGEADEVRAVDREATGFDFLVKSKAENILVRCEAGSRAPSMAVAREIAASLVDHCGSQAWIVTASSPSRALSAYGADRSIVVIPPWRVDDHLAGPESAGES